MAGALLALAADARAPLPRVWQLEEEARAPPLRFRAVGAPHRLVADAGGWRVDDGAGRAVARAATHALHPATVLACEWTVRVGDDGWAHSTMRFSHLALDTSRERPADLAVLGWDYFAAAPAERRVWFVCPETGAPVHSGAKRMHAGESAGRRYCHRCRRCVSANNWGDHLARAHPHAPRGRTLTEILTRALAD
jgi:hypothetical protein